MIQIIVKNNDSGQRFDKYLLKYLNQAPSGFIYKMLRKKNIVLNGKKAKGCEKLADGDEIKIFLSDDTIAKFRETTKQVVIQENFPFEIIYEDENICLMNKQAGILSQKAREEDVSMVEYFISYLLETNQIKKEELDTFRPAVVNRLDRNTSGIIIGGKTLLGLQEMSALLKSRDLHKYYLCIVDGVMEGTKLIKGYLTKNSNHNKVTVSNTETDESLYIETQYRALKNNGKCTLLEVWLVTGRPHQIRAHLSSIGHPIIGDGKYGNPYINKKFKQLYQLKSQFLHSYKIEFPEIKGELEILSGRTFIADLPDKFKYILKKEGLDICLHGIQED